MGPGIRVSHVQVAEDRFQDCLRLSGPGGVRAARREPLRVHVRRLLLRSYKTFPIQPIEAIVAVAIVLFTWLREKRSGFAVTGEHYPLMLILFGYSRFLLEFARDNEKVFLGISNLAIHALIMGIVGTAWYVTQREANKKRAAKKRR